MRFSKAQIRILLLVIFSFADDIYSEGHQEAGYTNTDHKLAILVPFRDRFDEIIDFIPYMNHYLMHQRLPYHIYILNQVDSYRFNRAALINVGFKETSDDKSDYICMHDVDLLPRNPNLPYGVPPKDGVMHISSPQLHPKYHYKRFIGGILSIRRSHFSKVNGLSNTFWGWGMEDDEFYMRLKEAKIKIYNPTVNTGSSNTFIHDHDAKKRPRDYKRSPKQQKLKIHPERDRVTGLQNVAYYLRNRREIKIGIASATLLDIELHCDENLVPWCLK